MASLTSHASGGSTGPGRMPATGSAGDPVPESGAAATRRRLLDAAEKLFAENGFADTSVRDLTGEAGANLASVNYHFGGKENLYVAVWQRMLVDMRNHRLAAIEQAMSQPDPTVEDLTRALALSLIQPMIDSPQRGQRMLQIYGREMSEPLLPDGMFHREMIEPVAHRVADAMTQLVPGLTRQQAVLCLLSLAGQVLHLMQMRKLFGDVPLPEDVAMDIDMAIEHIVKFSSAGIRHVAESTP